MFMKKNNQSKYFTVLGKKYAFDLSTFLKICLISNRQDSREKEITNVYNAEENDVISLTSKVERELKTDGNPQNDAIVWDFIKILIDKLMQDNTITFDNDEFIMDMPTALAFNTLLKEGIIIEIKED